MDDAGIIPLYHVKEYVMVRPQVRGFGISPFGQPDVTGITLANHRQEVEERRLPFYDRSRA